MNTITINKTASVGKSTSIDSTTLRTFNNMRIIQAIANHMAKLRQEVNSGQPKTMVDEVGRVWKSSSSEGIPMWVSNDPYPQYSVNWPMPLLKKSVIAVRVAIFRG